ncbi:MAG TPA: hypothetical protein VGB47_04495 [Thermoanaerobaculia bacterium]
MSEIGLVEIRGGVQHPSRAEGVPRKLVDAGTVTLRFLFSPTGGTGLEALRNARRALLREEWTRGRDPDEPSLEDAVFSTKEILWVVRPEQRFRCLQKLEELRRRANQLLTETDHA